MQDTRDEGIVLLVIVYKCSVITAYLGIKTLGSCSELEGKLYDHISHTI